MQWDSLKYLFIDLDNTLWDFDTNAEKALIELFHTHKLNLRSGKKSHDFVSTYKKINEEFWKRYEKGEIAKEFLRTERFTETFRQMGIPEEEHPENVWEEYINICPAMTTLVPGAMEFLQVMKPDFQIGILTNGFQKTQETKIRHSGIENYIDFMLTSEAAAVAKPQKEFFEMALKIADVEKHACIYIGDTWRTDMLGAIDAGIHAIWFNPEKKPAETHTHSPLYLGEFADLNSIAGLIKSKTFLQ